MKYEKNNMNQNKTHETEKSVREFINSLEDEKKRDDSFALLTILEEITHLKPKMWGNSIIGFGTYHYRYKSGREGNYFKIGFSPRKKNFTIYLMDGMLNNVQKTKDFNELGKFSTGKSCLYITKLQNIDITILKQIMQKLSQFLDIHLGLRDYFQN